MLRVLARVDDGSAVNIGSGQLVSFREVAQLFARLEGYEARIQPLVDKPVGVHSRYADIQHMEATLEWRPTISIQEGFRRVLKVAHERLAADIPP
jgi:UDP-glucose 4-epimerase